MRRGLGFILIVCGLCLLWSCGTKKNTKASRFYHALTTRYNIYYNGKVAFDEALLGMEEGYKENYSDMIYLHAISAQPKDKAEPGGAFDRTIEKSNKAIKLHSIKTKPAKKPGWRNDPKQVALQAKEEYNPFLKNSWLIMGQAQFYNADFLQASATFSYIARHYGQDPEVVAEATLWQARCYSELDWLYEAEMILDRMNKNGFPPSCKELYDYVYADYLIKSKKYQESIPYLKSSIKAEGKRRQRARMRYLLGQIYAHEGQDALAYETFGRVARSNPPYELEFASRIRQTEVFPGGNFNKVVKMLERMSRSSKNKDYLDQVYYALGNLYMTRQDTTNAVKQYQLGVEKSTQNGLDKAICALRLGDIYFTRRDYVSAQPSFSDALASMPKEYKEYPRVSKLSAVLDELVVHVQAVHLQDSLQALAKMPEAERLAVIDKIIEQVIKEEEEAKALAEKEAYLAEQESKGTGIDRPGTEINTVTIPVGGNESTFYFYNPQTVAQGKTQFQRKWGRRPLEDDWRRRKKELSTFNEPMDDEMADAEAEGAEGTEGAAVEGDAAAGAPDEGLEPVAADDPHKREYYLQQIPFTPEDVEASNVIIVDGLYNMAMIYKDKLEDIPLAIEGFETLDNRFPDNKYKLESYFQIYLMALRKGDNALAETYKAKIIQAFPQSDYAVAVADPNYLENIRTMDAVQDSVYQKTYESYLAGDTTTVRSNYRWVGEKYPLASLMPKFMFLEALSYVQSGEPERFKEALKALIEKYPDADVTKLAGEMLKGVLRGRAMVQGDVRGMSWNLRFGVGADGTLSAEDSARVFSPEPNVPYETLLMYPAGAVDENRLLFAVAAYNFTNFMVKELDMAFEDLGPARALVIRGFVNADEAIHYYKLIHGEGGYARELDRVVAIFPISGDNYETLTHGKTIEEYIHFFDENFGDRLPELAARWKARMEAVGEATREAAEAVEATRELVGEEIPMIEVPADLERIDLPESSVVIPVAQPAPSASKATPAPENAPAMTLEEIEAIRDREKAAEEARRAEAREADAAREKAAEEERARRADELKALREKQEAEDKALLKAKREREKQLERERKEQLKQAEAERKAKLKARQAELKAKERARKEKMKQAEAERKAKLKARQAELKAKEKARKAELKAKEKARKEALKAKEAAAREN